MRAYSAKNCDKENAQAVAFIFLNTACKIKPFVGQTYCFTDRFYNFNCVSSFVHYFKDFFEN